MVLAQMWVAPARTADRMPSGVSGKHQSSARVGDGAVGVSLVEMGSWRTVRSRFAAVMGVMAEMEELKDRLLKA